VKRAVEAGVVSQSMRLHDTRHWQVTRSIEDGVDLNTVADRVGHASPAFTLAVYGHSYPGRDQECADRLGARLAL
jgi:integrase